MDVRMPDGTVVTNVPDGTTQQELLTLLRQNSGAKVPSIPKAEEPYMREARQTLSVTPAELIAANPVVRTATAAARPVLGVADLVERLWGGSSNRERLRQLDEMQRRGNAALGFGPAGVAADVAGSVLSPVTGVATQMPAAASLGGRILQGAELGGLAGVTSGEDNPVQAAGVGAAVGGAVPAVVSAAGKTGGAAYHAVIEPWANPAAIKGRTLLDAAGDKASQIVNLLRQNQEIVPGAAPTAGEAAVPAGRAEFSALQRSAANVMPSEYVARGDAQNAARIAALRTVGETPADLEAAKTARSFAGARDYAAVAHKVIQPDQAFQAILERPSMQRAVTVAKSLAAERGIPFPEDLSGGLSVGNAQTMKMALDDLLKNPERFGLGASEANAIAQTRGQFINWLANASPGWQNARVNYAKASEPINQMEIGQYLEKKLVPSLSDEAKQKAATYATALQEAPTTIKKATGAPRFQELSQVLTPDQLAAVNSVRDDLARGARFDFLAQKGAKNGPNAVDMATASMEREAGGRLPNLLYRPAMVMNAIISRLEGKINKKLAAELAVEMLNPPKTAETMAMAARRAERNKALADTIQRFTLPGAAVAGQEATQ